MAQDLAELTADATFSVSVGTYNMVSDTRVMTAEMKAVLHEVKGSLKYQVRQAHICMVVCVGWCTLVGQAHVGQ